MKYLSQYTNNYDTYEGEVFLNAISLWDPSSRTLLVSCVCVSCLSWVNLRHKYYSHTLSHIQGIRYEHNAIGDIPFLLYF